MNNSAGTQWNIFGEAVAEPRAGAKLTPTTSFDASSFAWGTFYPGAEIHER